MLSKRKGLWAALASGALVFLFIPSVVLLERAGDYWRFLSGWNPETLRLTPPFSSIPHRPVPIQASRTQFVEFAYASAAARAVELGGDFNLWRSETLPLKRTRAGRWAVLVPLPPGRYHYLFKVDGEWTLDPKGEAVEERGGRPTSVRQVVRSGPKG